MDFSAIRSRLASTEGRLFWRSLGELADTPQFREYLHREFPQNATEWIDPVGRRDFLKLMSASMALGMTLIRYRNEFSHWLASTLHIEIFPREVYQFSSIPAEVIPKDVAIICISAFFICSVAALIPAYFAARLDPVKALRYE